MFDGPALLSFAFSPSVDRVTLVARLEDDCGYSFFVASAGQMICSRPGRLLSQKQTIFSSASPMNWSVVQVASCDANHGTDEVMSDRSMAYSTTFLARDQPAAVGSVVYIPMRGTLILQTFKSRLAFLSPSFPRSPLRH